MKLFTNIEKGVFLNVDLEKDSKAKLEGQLLRWLEVEHEDIFLDIEGYEGGAVMITDEELYFSGDNGVFIMNATKVEELEF
jgi:hypothetical protein